MKILLVVTGLGMGGAERQVIDLSERLFTKGHEVAIAYLTGPERLMPSSEEIKVYSIGITGNPLSLIFGFFRLLRLIHSLAPDVIHSHMVHANIISRVARIFARVPRLICSAHSRNEGGSLRMLAYRITDGLADVSTNVGVDAVQAFEAAGAVPKGKMLSMVNGIDVEKFIPDAARRLTVRNTLGFSQKQVVILAVGRFYEAKDYPNLLQAFAILKDEFPNARLCIAGDGPLMNQVKKLAVDLELDGRIDFLGARNDVPDLMRAADIYVLSSAWEGLPLVVGEAMASEKLVVATDCGGVREFLGDAGILAAPKSPAALADGLREALNMPADETSALGSRARLRIVNNYSLDSVADGWVELYSHLSSRVS